VPVIDVSGSSKGVNAAGRDWRGRLPFFYGWLIVAGAVACLGLNYSVFYSFSVFYVALLEDFGWSRAEAAGIQSVFFIVCGAGSLVAGALADRFGPGRVVACGGTLLACGLLVCSVLTQLWQFYICYGIVVALAVATAGWTPCVTILNRWFSTRLGLALGIASGGIGFGIMVIVPVLQVIINNFGWRTAYASLAGIVFFGLIPVGLLVLRGRPEDLGQQLDGASQSHAPRLTGGKPRVRKTMEVVDKEWVAREWTLTSALKTARCWLLSGVKLLGGIAHQMVFVHQVVFLVDGGYDRTFAASIVGLIGMLSMGTKVFWGWCADTIGRELTYALGCATMVAAIGLLGLTRVAPFPGLIYLYAIMFALGYGVSAPLWPVITADLFAGRNLGSIFGFVTAFSGVGNAIGAWLGGYVYDITGSYAWAFGVAAIGKAASAAALYLVAPGKVRRVCKTTVA
jgi:MFS family permease